MTNTPKLDTLAARLKWLREKREMSAADLCRATRTATEKPLSQPTLWAIEVGRTKNIKAATLFRIAGALSASPSWLRDGTGSPFDMATPSDAEFAEAMQIMATLSPDKKAMILAALKAIAS